MSPIRRYYIIAEMYEVEVSKEQFENYIANLRLYQDYFDQKVWSEVDSDFPDLVYWFYESGDSTIHCQVGYSCLK